MPFLGIEPSHAEERSTKHQTKHTTVGKKAGKKMDEQQVKRDDAAGAVQANEQTLSVVEAATGEGNAIA
jgi:hypothetical protein